MKDHVILKQTAFDFDVQQQDPKKPKPTDSTSIEEFDKRTKAQYDPLTGKYLSHLTKECGFSNYGFRNACFNRCVRR